LDTFLQLKFTAGRKPLIFKEFDDPKDAEDAIHDLDGSDFLEQRFANFLQIREGIFDFL
jgi:hypothetical protein